MLGFVASGVTSWSDRFAQPARCSLRPRPRHGGVVRMSEGNDMSAEGLMTDSVLEVLWEKNSNVAFEEGGASRKPDATTDYSTGSIVSRMLGHVQSRRNLGDFLQLFQGEFDNYEQVMEEKAAGLYPREGNGHEHIHCKLDVVDSFYPWYGMIFAKYYFDGDPSLVFRCRMYEVLPMEEEDGVLEMKIYRISQETEKQLREVNYEPKSVDWKRTRALSHLSGCNVYWERMPEESVHLFEGHLRGNCCKVFSPTIHQNLTIRDDLTINLTHLAVNDRGFDESGNFVYGNRQGVPYVMRRVVALGDSLWWTIESDQETREKLALNTSMKQYVQQKNAETAK